MVRFLISAELSFLVAVYGFQMVGCSRNLSRDPSTLLFFTEGRHQTPGANVDWALVASG